MMAAEYKFAECNSTSEKSVDLHSDHDRRVHNNYVQEKQYGYKGRDHRPDLSRDEYYISDRLDAMQGPTTDLVPFMQQERKFSGRCRLFIGNLPLIVSEEDIVNVFKSYGETSDVFINKEKLFGFIKLDYPANAEKAKMELNGYLLKGKILIIKFAHPAIIHVKNLSYHVTNELLHLSFSVFGEIERCFIITDKRGKSCGEGIVEYTKKSSAALAIKHCNERCYFVSSSLKPVIVEDYELPCDTSGYPEQLVKRTEEYYRDREMPPRFATPGTFQHDYGQRWKDLQHKYKEKIASLKNQLFWEEQKWEAEVMSACYDHETNRLKQLLHIRELDKERYKQKWEMRNRHLEDEYLGGSKTTTYDNSDPQQPNNLYTTNSQLSNLLTSNMLHEQDQWKNHSSEYSSQISQTSITSPHTSWIDMGNNPAVKRSHYEI